MDAATGCWGGDFLTIERDIGREIQQAYDGNKGQPDVEKSTEKLEKAVDRWRRGRFRLSDKTTWDTCWDGFAAVPDIEWTESDRRDIGLWLPPAIGKQHRGIAANVAQGMVKLTAVKHASEDGIAYEYWQDFLTDEYGIACSNRNKMSNILTAAKELELIQVHSKPIWFSDGRKGCATIYAPGQRVATRVVLAR